MNERLGQNVGCSGAKSGQPSHCDSTFSFNLPQVSLPVFHILNHEEGTIRYSRKRVCLFQESQPASTASLRSGNTVEPHLLAVVEAKKASLCWQSRDLLDPSLWAAYPNVRSRAATRFPPLTFDSKRNSRLFIRRYWRLTHADGVSVGRTRGRMTAMGHVHHATVPKSRALDQQDCCKRQKHVSKRYDREDRHQSASLGLAE